MSLLDEIANPVMDPYSYAMSVERRPTPFFEWLGARTSRGFDEMFISQGLRALNEPGTRIESSAAYAAERGGLSQWETDELIANTTQYLDAMTRDQWEASPSYRPGLPFQEGQTVQTWKNRADYYDANQFRNWQIQNRDAGFWEGTAGFISELAGGAVDPINYIPFGGAAFRAAFVARGFGRTAAHVLASGTEAALATAVTEPFTLHRRSLYGEDVGFATAVTDIAMGALTGGAIATASPLVKAVYRATKGAVERGAERFNLMSPQPIEVERRSLAVLDKAVGDTANNRRIDVGPEAASAMRLMRRLTPGDEALTLELRQRLREKGIDADIVLTRPASPYPGTGRAGPAAAARASGTITPQPSATPPTGAARWTAAAVQRELKVGFAEASRIAEARNAQLPGEQVSPASRAAFEAKTKRDLERNAANTLTAAEGQGATLRAQMRELSRLPDGPEKEAQLAQLKEQIRVNDGTIKTARLALREGVTMPSAAELDIMHARAVEGMGGPEGAAAPMPAIDRIDTTVGRDTPEETGAPQAAEVAAQPVKPMEETQGVNPESGDFDELATYEGALRLGRIAPEDHAAFTIADAEFKKSKQYPSAFEAGALCLAE